MMKDGFDKFNEYTVQRGDNLYNIAKEYNVDSRTLQLVNGLESDEYIYTGQKLLVPKSNIGVYMVDENETLSGVALKNNIKVEEIVQNNETIYLLPEQLLFFKKGKIS